MISVNRVRIEQTEKVNYDIAEGMLRYCVKKLNTSSLEYNTKFQNDTRDYAHSRTEAIINFLKEKTIYTDEMGELVRTNTLDLNFEITEHMKDFFEVSLGLGRIVSTKFGEDYLKSLRRGKNNHELDKTVNYLTTQGEVLSNTNLVGVRRIITEYDSNLALELGLNKEDIDELLKKLEAYSTIYLLWLKNNNKFMYGNFVNMLNTLKGYLTNYIKSKDNLIKVTARGDELGAIRSTKSLIETLEDKKIVEGSYLNGVKLKVC